MSTKTRFPRAIALDVARHLCKLLEPACVRMPDGKAALKVCGSLRRGRAEVGDIELVYIPRVETVPEQGDIFGDAGKTVPLNRADEEIDRMLATKLLARRLNKLGRSTWGRDNKLAVHVQTNVPVDLFATSAEAWWSYVVCRTGSAATNTRIATAAIRKGWRWHPTMGFFTDVLGRRQWISSEEDVFQRVGLPYLEPAQR